mgnify:CR=1 FL=1
MKAMEAVDPRHAGPASATQRRHWVLEKTHALGNAYHVPVLLSCHGPLSLSRLRVALALLANRHAALRTALPVVAGRPVQLVGSLDGIVPRVVDLSGSPQAQGADADAWRVAVENVARGLLAWPFDLDRGPLFRCFVLRRSNDEAMLLFDIHHAVCDAWSLRLIQADFERFYASDPGSLDDADWEEDLGYMDFARERHGATPPDRAFWTSYLAGAVPYIALPPGPDGRESAATERLIVCTGADAHAVFASCRSAKVTLFVYLQAVLHLALRAVGVGHDQLTGTVVAGRRDARFRNTVGCFVNYLPVRTRSHSGQSFADFVAGVRDDVIAALEHQEDEFETIVDCAPVRGTHPRNPLFNVALVVQNTGLAALEADHRCADLLITPVPVPSLAPSLDLRVVVTSDADTLRICLESDERTVSPLTAQRLEYAMRHVLGHVMDDEPTAIDDLILMAVDPAPSAHGTVRLMSSSSPAPLERALRGIVGRLGLDVRIVTSGERAWRGESDDRLDVVVFDGADWSAHEWPDDVEERLRAALPAEGLVLDIGDPAWPLAPAARVLRDALRSLPGFAWEPLTELTHGDARHLASEPGLGMPLAWLDIAARRIARAVMASIWRDRPPKVLVLDCDDTLWLGLCAEQGAEGVAIGPREAAIQEFALRQWERGVLLAVCSRNRPDDVMAVFERRTDMRIGARHLSSWAIGWEPKSRMLARIAAELSVSTDALVFLDDDAMQVGEVRHVLPEVRAIHMPVDDRDARSFLNAHWAFDTVVESREAAERRQAFADGGKRREMRDMAHSHDAFMQLLEARVEVREAQDGDAGRVAELAVRTNQFNTTGEHLSAARVDAWLRDGTARVFVARLADRFGDYGLIGALFASVDATGVNVQHLFLSCRAMDRGVELELLRAAASLAKAGALAHVRMRASATGRNLPAMDFAAWLADEVRAAPCDGRIDMDAGSLLDVNHRWRGEGRVSLPDASVGVDGVWPAAVDAIVLAGIDEPMESLRTPVETAVVVRGAAGIVRSTWEDILGVTGWDEGADFFELGGTSLAALDMLGVLRERYGVRIGVADFLNRPTVAFVTERLEASEPAPSADGPDDAHAPGLAPLLPAQRRFWILQEVLDDTSIYHVPLRLEFRTSPTWAVLNAALRDLLHRHPALRSRIVPGASHGGEPLQCETYDVGLRLVDADDATSLEDAWSTMVGARFRLDAEPPFRVALVRRQATCELWCVFHHAAVDARSIDRLATDLDRLLAGRALEPGLSWKAYADLCATHRTRMLEALPAGLPYWRSQMKGHRSTLDLPRPSASGSLRRRYARIPLRISLAATARLGQLAREHETTIFVLVLAAVAIVLHRYSRQDDITFGTTVDTRAGYLAKDAVGCFVNTLPLRMRIDGGETAARFVHAVRDVVAGALAHREVPFERIAEAARSSTSERIEPFEVMVQHLGPSLSTPASHASPFLTQAGTHEDGAQQKFGLLVLTHESAEGLSGTIEHDIDRFDGAVVAGIAEHLQYLLECIAAWIAMPVGTIPLATPGDLAKLDARNATRTAFPGPWTLIDMFMDSAARYPGAPAVIEGGRTVSYAELKERAMGLAGALGDAGVRPDDTCGISVRGGVRWITAALAIQFAGGAFVPLDADWPAARKARVVEQASVALAVTDRPRTDAVLPCRLLDLRGALPSASRPLVPSDPGRVAYVIFTSGSTGQPKGVVIRHSAACNTLLDLNEAFSVGPVDRVLALSSFGFDLSIYDIFGSFAAGAAVVVPTSAEFRTPAAWHRLIRTHAVTLWNSVPALFEQYLLYLDGNGTAGTGGLRLAMLSGDRIPPALPRHAWRHDAGLAVHSLGGATEASIWSIGLRLEPRDGSASPIPYGRPLRNQTIAILDERHEPCPDHVVGEIYIGGDGVAEGYAGDPVQSEARFVVAFDGRRWYRTGDLGVSSDDGMIHILGRMDTQVKVNGHRIECGDVVSALLGIHGVNDAIVVARGDGAGRYLAAYVVTASSQVTAATLDHALRASLPEYMVPRAWCLCDTLPRSANDKVDIGSLPAPQPLVADVPTDAFPARSPLEKHVVEACGFAMPDSGEAHLNEDFFARGGDSLQAMAMTSRLSHLLGHEVSVRLLYTHPRLGDLAQALAMEGRGTGDGIDPATEVREIAGWLGTSRVATAERPDGPRLLTGATGFLGAFMLEALLDAEPTPVWCLVRCRSEAEGRARLLERARFFGASIDASRVEIVPGDVGEPLLGMSTPWREAILREVKHVYHSAAQVDFLRGYASLKAANVMSVVELGRLALDAPGMRLHFVSSRNVLDLVGGGIEEHMRQPWHERLNDGYAQSKWVAEQVVVALHERGVPCVIYRPSRIVAASRSQGVNLDEFLNRALRASARLALEPGYSGADNMVPVDYAARAIVALSQVDAGIGGAFHVQHPRETPLSLVLDRLRHRLAREGRIMGTSGRREWIDAIQRDDPAQQPLFALLPLLRVGVDDDDTPATLPAPVPSEKADVLLRALGVECPAIDEAHVDRLIALALM